MHTSIKKNCRYIILIGFILILSIGLFYYCNIRGKRNTNYKVILFNDKKEHLNKNETNINIHNKNRRIALERIHLDKAGSLTGREDLNFSFPFNSDDFEKDVDDRDRVETKLNRILFDKRQNRFIFSDYYLNDFSSGTQTYLCIIKNNNSRFEIVKTEIFSSLYTCGISHPVEVSSDGKKILSSMGDILDLTQDSLNYYSLNPKGASKHLIVLGAIYFGNSILLLTKDIYEHKKQHLILYDSDNSEIKQNIDAGLSLYDHPYGLSYPLSKSPDNKNVAFFHLDDSFSYSIGVFNVDTLKITNSTELFKYHKLMIILNENPIIEWSNKCQTGFIAAKLGFDENIILYNHINNQIFDTIKIGGYIKSLRWSPDDRKLGILVLGSYYNIGEIDKSASTKGVLYIYDLDTKNLTKLMDCPDCFDFHFVE